MAVAERQSHQACVESGAGALEVLRGGGVPERHALQRLDPAAWHPVRLLLLLLLQGGSGGGQGGRLPAAAPAAGVTSVPRIFSRVGAGAPGPGALRGGHAVGAHAPHCEQGGAGASRQAQARACTEAHRQGACAHCSTALQRKTCLPTDGQAAPQPPPVPHLC